MRNYSVLEDIYLADIEKIEANKGKMDINLSECILAVKCYSQSTDKLNLEIAQIIFDEYTEKHHSKEDINDLINLTKNVSYNGEKLIGKMVKNPYIKNFISENQLDTVDFINENLRLDSITEKDKYKINTLIEIECLKKVLKDDIDLEDVGYFINVGKEAARIIIDKNQNTNKSGYSPLAVFLAEDIVETLVSNYLKNNSIEANLWSNVKRYNLTNIGNAQLEEMKDLQGPQHLAQAITEPVYEANWVLLESGEIQFASTHYAYGKHRQICHTDLANGESVVSAGVAYFSSDKKTLLAIDNKSGHYQPSLDSVFKTIPIFENSDININNAIVSQFGWDEPKPFKDYRKSNNEVADRINKIRMKSFLNSEPTSSASPKIK